MIHLPLIFHRQHSILQTSAVLIGDDAWVSSSSYPISFIELGDDEGKRNTGANFAVFSKAVRVTQAWRYGNIYAINIAINRVSISPLP